MRERGKDQRGTNGQNKKKVGKHESKSREKTRVFEGAGAALPRTKEVESNKLRRVNAGSIPFQLKHLFNKGNGEKRTRPLARAP